MRLHLGCGQRYLKGYVNIDFPLSEHSVQESSVADQLADLRELRYKRESVEEIRNHHVFEHFPKAVAAAMLASWNSWLKMGGVIHIEVPDFERTARSILRTFASEARQAAGLRHIFGSQEAHWAIHYEGYTATRLRKFLSLFGFENAKVRRNKYLATYNFEIIARKTRGHTIESSRNVARQYLKPFLIAEVPGELAMLEIWMHDFETQLGKSFST